MSRKFDDEVVDTHGAQALLGVANQTIRRWRCTGDGPRFLKIGRRVLYRLTDLREWRDQHLVSSTADASLRASDA